MQTAHCESSRGTSRCDSLENAPALPNPHQASDADSIAYFLKVIPGTTAPGEGISFANVAM
jgi:hypothetical protein